MNTITKTIRYKGGTITLTHTTPEWRNRCRMNNNILCWFNTRGYLEERVLINNMDSAKPAVTLNYIRKRILNAQRPAQHTNEKEKCSCGGDYVWSRHCGANVCEHCDDHQRLARCYCGWAKDGGNGRHQLEEMGETIDAE